MKKILLILLSLNLLVINFAQGITLNIVSVVEPGAGESNERIKDIRNGIYFLRSNPNVQITEFYTADPSKNVVDSTLKKADIIIYSGGMGYFFATYLSSDTGKTDYVKLKSNSIVMFVDVIGFTGKSKGDTATISLDVVSDNINSISSRVFNTGAGCYYGCPDYRLSKVLKGFIDGKSVEEIIRSGEGQFQVYSPGSTLTITSIVHNYELTDRKEIFMLETKYWTSSKSTPVFNLLNTESSFQEACVAAPNYSFSFKK